MPSVELGAEPDQCDYDHQTKGASENKMVYADPSGGIAIRQQTHQHEFSNATIKVHKRILP